MGLVRLETENREDLFLLPEQVESIASSCGSPTSTVSMKSGAKWLVRGHPRELHAALFPPPSYEVPKVPKKMQEKLLAALGQNSQGGGIDQWVPVDMGEPAKEFRSELADALDPATYSKEWENHSPNCARAMAWALGLVRTRLGVGK